MATDQEIQQRIGEIRARLRGMPEGKWYPMPGEGDVETTVYAVTSANVMEPGIFLCDVMPDYVANAGPGIARQAWANRQPSLDFFTNAGRDIHFLLRLLDEREGG